VDVLKDMDKKSAVF